MDGFAALHRRVHSVGTCASTGPKTPRVHAEKRAQDSQLVLTSCRDPLRHVDSFGEKGDRDDTLSCFNGVVAVERYK